MLLRFTKMHGLGNDFVVLDGVTQELVVTPEMARHLSDRHFGIGGNLDQGGDTFNGQRIVCQGKWRSHQLG